MTGLAHVAGSARSSPSPRRWRGRSTAPSGAHPDDLRRVAHGRCSGRPGLAVTAGGSTRQVRPVRRRRGGDPRAADGEDHRRRRFIRWAAGVASTRSSRLFGGIWGQFGCCSPSRSTSSSSRRRCARRWTWYQQQENTFGYSFWESYTLFVDPGTQTGLNEETERHLAYRAYIVIVSLVGFVWMLIFLGMVVEQMRFLMDRWRRKYGRTAVSGHTLVLGWTDNTLLPANAQMRTTACAATSSSRRPRRARHGRRGGGRTDWRASFPTVRLPPRKPREVDDLLRVSRRRRAT